MKSFASPVDRGLMALGSAAAVLYLVALALPSPPMGLLTKAVPVLCLAAAVASRATDGLGRLVAAGLLLSAAGDLLLELGSFLPGLGAFLVAHVLYTLAFLSVTRRPALGWALPFALYGAFVFLYLRPHLGSLASAVLAYTVAICTMLWRAGARVGSPGGRRAAGSVSPALSSSPRATRSSPSTGSAAPCPGARYPIIVLYWLGQLGIAASVTLPKGETG